MKANLIASTGTKEKLQKIVNQFYCSENWVINEENKLFNTKTGKFATGVQVMSVKNRWRFEMV